VFVTAASVTPGRASASIKALQAFPNGQYFHSAHSSRFAAHLLDTTLEGRGDFTCIGTAAFDREQIPPRDLVHASSHSPAPSPLNAILEGYEINRENAFRRLAGRFAFVLLDELTQELFAVRDPLGERPLYYSFHDREIVVADTLQCFEASGSYSRDFFAEFIATSGCCRKYTVWKGVLPVPAGSIVHWKNGELKISCYWSPDSFTAGEPVDPRAAAEQCRALITAAVRNCLTPGTWAHLSGGLDSSSVVSVAGLLNERGTVVKGLDGTLTHVDGLCNLDDPKFSQAVTTRYGFRNEQVTDEWPWRNDGEPPPLSDHPTRDYPYYARDRVVERVIKAAGGGSLLTGIGPDLYFPSSFAHISDLIWQGQFRNAAEELQRWTVSRGESLWKTIPEHVFVPLASPSLRTAIIKNRLQIPSWLSPDFVRVCALEEHLLDGLTSGDARGTYYQALTTRTLRKGCASLPGWRHLPGIQLRHPLLHLDLVEFCLQLPCELRTNGNQSKPILRAAMTDIVPTEVRLRRTKGSISPRIAWSLRKERVALEQLMEHSVLAEYGCLDPKKVLKVLDDFSTGRSLGSLLLYPALSLETWLSTRSGRCIHDVN
jgi:asparagine synthase (glutamine-hydrolysing)